MPVTVGNIQFVVIAYAVSAIVLLTYAVYVHRAVRRARAAFDAAAAAATTRGR